MPSRRSLAQAKGNADELMEKSKTLKKSIQEAEEREKAVIVERDNTVVLIGNIVHDSVPVSNDEVRASHSTQGIAHTAYAHPMQDQGQQRYATRLQRTLRQRLGLHLCVAR